MRGYTNAHKETGANVIFVHNIYASFVSSGTYPNPSHLNMQIYSTDSTPINTAGALYNHLRKVGATRDKPISVGGAAIYSPSQSIGVPYYFYGYSNFTDGFGLGIQYLKDSGLAGIAYYPSEYTATITDIVLPIVTYYDEIQGA